jgi:polar amino acid transport system permease protein
VLVILLLTSADYRWRWVDVWTSGNTEWILGGLVWTLLVSAGSMVVGLLLGVAAGLGRMSSRLVLRFYATIYVEVIRGTPLLVQILIVFYCLSTVIRVEEQLVLGIIALGFFSGAYVAEIFRAGVEAVPRGQMEAARSLGMSHRQAMIHVVGPQALRNALPPLAGQFISLVKDSSLLMLVGVPELSKRADELAAMKYSPFEVYLPLAGLYLLLTLPLSRFTQWLEKKMGGGRREARL